MHADPKIRREAVSQLEDPTVLTELVRTDPDDRVREEAADTLLDLVLGAEDEASALSALAGLSEMRHLVGVARPAPIEEVSRAALARLTDARAIGSVARNGEHAPVRLEALARLDVTDGDAIYAVALKSAHKDVALAAMERIAALREGQSETPLQEILSAIARRARSRAAVHRARALLRERDQEDTEGSRGGTASDQDRQLELCSTLETLARAEGTKRLAAQISAVHDAWTDLLPNVDEDLENRFQSAYETARRHLAQNQTELLERRRREREQQIRNERYLAPRLGLIEKVASAEGERSAVLLEDARSGA